MGSIKLHMEPIVQTVKNECSKIKKQFTAKHYDSNYSNMQLNYIQV